MDYNYLFHKGEWYVNKFYQPDYPYIMDLNKDSIFLKLTDVLNDIEENNYKYVGVINTELKQFKLTNIINEY